MNYQGKLTNNSGLAVADGTYAMEFKLYTQSSGGSAIWTETRSGGNVVTVTNGLFSVMLGSVTSLSSVNFNQPLYLGVNVASDGEMTPRKALGTVPSAFEAEQLGGVASTSFLRSDAADSASGLLTFTGGVVSTASSSIARFNFTNATGTSLYIGGDRITDFSGTNLEVVGNSLGLSSTYLGQTSITTLGTVGTGTWQGSVISSTYLDTATILSTEIDTSAELAGILGDETGFSSGALSVFSISPVITGTADFVAGDFSSTLLLVPTTFLGTVEMKVSSWIVVDTSALVRRHQIIFCKFTTLSISITQTPTPSLGIKLANTLLLVPLITPLSVTVRATEALQQARMVQMETRV